MEQFTVERDGFHGFLHRPQNDQYPGKALIVVGGSEGNDNIPVHLGEKFAQSGLTTLGLCYWNVPGLPTDLTQIPIESIEAAVKRLLKLGYNKVGMYGISKGGELTLLASSLLPQITCVVAVSPLQCVMEGITGNGSILKKQTSGHSSWTWRGKELPFAPCRTSRLGIKMGVLRGLLTRGQMDMRFLYSAALDQAPAEAAIPVEQINGSVLLLSAAEDSMWPSSRACSEVKKRLEAHEFRYPVQWQEYEKASHILVPMETSMLKSFRVERKFPEECRQSRQDAFQKTLAFLRRW